MSRTSSHGMNWSARRLTVVVNEAETGRRIPVELVQGEDGVEALRSQLYRFTGVPPANQILLYGGPPYKALRSQLPSRVAEGNAETMDTMSTAKPTSISSSTTNPAASDTDPGTNKNRIFLFDWRTLAPDPTAPGASLLGRGDPGSSLARVGAVTTTGNDGDEAEIAEFVGAVEVVLPTVPRAAPSPLPSAEGSVLLATIANYERGSMLALNRGQAYADSSARRLKGGEACVHRMRTQIDALTAAVSNSLDHWVPLQRGYQGLSEKLEEQALRHQGMLETFDQDLERLGTIPLHPSLAAATGLETSAVASGTEAVIGPSAAGEGSGVRSGAGQGSMGQLREGPGTGQQQRATLLDCVPVERERRLLESCRTSQRRFRHEAEVVAQKYAVITQGLEEQRNEPMIRIDKVQELLSRARELCREQEIRKGELEANYKESFERGTKENWTGDEEKQDAIQRMTMLTVTQEKIVPLMKDNDLQVMETVAEIARAKSVLSTTLRRRLREVSKLQTEIGKIQKHQELVGMAWGQKEEQFEHLGKVARMPAAYKAFLLEVLRRRQYHQDFETKVSEFCSSMAAMRSTEIVARDAFREAHLGNLPPVLLEMAPGLRNAPPAFIPPTVTPLYPGELPEVRPEDVESEPRSASPPQPPSRGLLSTETTLEEDEVSAVTAEETAATFVAGAALPAVAESAGRGTTTAATTTEEPSRSVVAIVADGTDKETEKDPSSATDTIAAIGVAPGGDEEEEGRSNTTRSASAVAVGEEAAEAVSTAQANAEAEAISVMDDSRMQAQVLLAENARLVEELASARNRLEELQSEKQEVDIEAAAAVLAAAPVVDTNAVETTAAAAATAVTPAVTAGTTTATTTTGTESLMLLRGESAPDDLGAATATGIAVPVENVVSAATAVASEIQKDGSKYPGSDRRRSTWSSSTTSSRRPPSEKKQLAAYRSGLWMLVKLVNQLATTAPGAGAGVVAGVGVGVSARGEWEASPHITVERALGDEASAVATAPVVSEQCAQVAGRETSPESAGVVAKDSTVGGGDSDPNAPKNFLKSPAVEVVHGELDDGAGDRDDGVNRSSGKETGIGVGEVAKEGDIDDPAGAVAINKQPENEVACVGNVEGETGDAVGGDECAKLSSEAASVKDTEETGAKDTRDTDANETGEEAGISMTGNAGVSTGVTAVVTAGVTPDVTEEGNRRDEDASPIVAESVATQDTQAERTDGSSAPAAVVVTVMEEGEGDEKEVASRSDAAAASTTAAAIPPAAALATAAAASLAGASSPDRTGNSGASLKEFSSPRNEAARRIARAAGDAGGAMDSAAVVVKSTGGVGRGSGSGLTRQGSSRQGADNTDTADGADVAKIRKAAERVAQHLKGMHERVEQLLPYEALASVPRISMCSFDVQDIALFLPTEVVQPDGSGSTVFLAFHHNCPNRFLSEESIATARVQEVVSYPLYILGRIIMIERHVASEEPNPYNVAHDTVYYVLTAENVC